MTDIWNSNHSNRQKEFR